MGNLTDLKSDTIPYLYALAAKLEGAGQYNNAKLCRALAEAISRQSAYTYRRHLPSELPQLAEELSDMAETLSDLALYPELVQALENGSQAIQDGRLVLVAETPHPYVCRTCGHLALEQPPHHCPVCRARGQTFQHFPPVYWLGNFDPFQSLHNLCQTPEDLAAILEGLSEEDCQKSPEEGGWNIRSAMAHVRDAQGVLENRLQLLLENERPLLEAQAVFEWAEEETSSPLATCDIFDSYRQSRQRTLAILQDLPLKDWHRSGFHQEFGLTTIAQQASYFATHELTHLPQIEALITGGSQTFGFVAQ